MRKGTMITVFLPHTFLTIFSFHRLRLQRHQRQHRRPQAPPEVEHPTRARGDGLAAGAAEGGQVLVVVLHLVRLVPVLVRHQGHKEAQGGEGDSGGVGGK